MQMRYQINDEREGRLSLIITELAPQYHQAAQDTGYTRTDDGFVREMIVHPAACQPDYLNRIVSNCHFHLESLLAQKAGLQPIPWDNALWKFLAIVEGKGIDWWLVGSAALAVRDIDVHPADIDLCTSEADALKLQDLLLDHLIQPVQDSTGWVGKWFGRAFLGAKLEWLGGVNASADADGISDFGPTAHSRLETVYWNGYRIRVPPLDLQLEVSLRRGLVERADKIRAALAIA